MFLISKTSSGDWYSHPEILFATIDEQKAKDFVCMLQLEYEELFKLHQAYVKDKVSWYIIEPDVFQKMKDDTITIDSELDVGDFGECDYVDYHYNKIELR